MAKPYVYITRKLPEDIIRELRNYATVGMWPNEDIVVPREVLLEEARKADALLTMLSDKIDSAVIDEGHSLKVVANMAVGFDNIDIEYATKKGIAICNTPEILTDTTADLTFALLTVTARRIVEAADFIKEGKWQSWSPLLLAGHDIHHKTLGIVGMGKIGEAVAKRATGFDMNILYHNRTRKEEAEARLGVSYSSFDKLIEESDFIVCLTPLTSETKHIFNREAFRRMKNSAIFVNVSRGPVVDEAALYESLIAGEIAGAGLDVFEQEPIPTNHPLLRLTNVVAIPHIGSSSYETRHLMMKLCIDNILAILQNKKPKTIVNKEWLQQLNNIT